MKENAVPEVEAASATATSTGAASASSTTVSLPSRPLSHYSGWMSNPPTVTHPVVFRGAIGLGSPSIPAGTSSSHFALKHPRTPPTNPSVDYPSGDFDRLSKRTRLIGISDEVNLPVNVLPVSFTGHSHSQAFSAPEDLPKTVTRTLNQGSSPMSIDRSCILKAHCPNLLI